MASLQRLKERRLVQWAIAYLAGAWVLFEVSDAVGGRLGWPDALYQGLILLPIVGFFGALVLVRSSAASPLSLSVGDRAGPGGLLSPEPSTWHKASWASFLTVGFRAHRSSDDLDPL